MDAYHQHGVFCSFFHFSLPSFADTPLLCDLCCCRRITCLSLNGHQSGLCLVRWQPPHFSICYCYGFRFKDRLPCNVHNTQATCTTHLQGYDFVYYGSKRHFTIIAHEHPGFLLILIKTIICPFYNISMILKITAMVISTIS